MSASPLSVLRILQTGDIYVMQANKKLVKVENKAASHNTQSGLIFCQAKPAEN